jgi:transcriptional regulator with XRE-family HTH domain
MKREEQIKALISQFLDAIASLPGREASAQTGISQMHISRLRAGKYTAGRITPSTVKKMETYLGYDTDEDTDSHPILKKVAAESKIAAHYEKILGRVSRSRNAEDARLRKLDALEGLRRFYSVTGVVPDWWFRLRQRVEAGEL